MRDQSIRPAVDSALSIGVRDLRARLAAQLARVEAGETIVVRRGGRPVARLAPLSEPPGPPVGYGLEDMARLGLLERPRSEPDAGPESSTVVAPLLPIDVRVDRIVRQVRG